MTEFVLADPHCRVFNVGRTTWMVSGSDPVLFEKTVEHATGKGSGVRHIFQELSKIAAEGTFVSVEPLDEGRERTTLFKTLSSTFDLYYRIGKSHVSVFDHFRNAIASVPASQRVLDENAFADHLLFAYEYLPGSHTLLKGIRKLTPGGMLEIGLDGNTRFEQLETLELPFGGDGPEVEDVVDRLDTIIAERISAYTSSFGEPTVLLSGGVDSTLVLSYLEKGASALTIGIETPEYDFEMDYARLSADLFDARHRMMILKESTFRRSIEELVELLGQPTGTAFFQPMAFHYAFKETDGLFLSGETVDALFGFNKIAKIFDRSMLSSLEREKLDREPWSLEGYSASCGLSPDLEKVRQVLGNDTVENRLHGRLDFALGLCPKLIGLEPVHWRAGHAEVMSIFTDFGHIREYIGRTRQQAFCRGSTVLTPFACRQVLELAMTMPMPQRIVRDGVVKHIAKSLLTKRVPGYPILTRKGGSDVPRTRFLQEGPLKDVFLGEAFPRFWPETHRDILLNPQRDSSFLGLSALSYALWQNRILMEQNLEAIPGTRTFQVSRIEGDPRA
ncbi:MAG TPA: hypothetical protein DDW96_02630 [Synergistaceae bacterium]|nr:hypothetical protein [Synergistaceae bacterium]HCP08029.1 hypothetical protein [Synergistaceae bacterium]